MFNFQSIEKCKTLYYVIEYFELPFTGIWNSLSDENIEILIFHENYDKQHSAHDSEYLRLRSEDVRNGFLPKYKPSRISYIQYLYKMQPIICKNYSNANKKISTMWDELSDEEQDKYDLSPKEYEEQMKEWQLYENIRKGLPLDVNMIKLLIEKSKERTTFIYHELLAKALHPDKVSKWLDYHLDNGGDLGNFVC
jgi:hypothetical protein